MRCAYSCGRRQQCTRHVVTYLRFVNIQGIVIVFTAFCPFKRHSFHGPGQVEQFKINNNGKRLADNVLVLPPQPLFFPTFFLCLDVILSVFVVPQPAGLSDRGSRDSISSCTNTSGGGGSTAAGRRTETASASPSFPATSVEVASAIKSNRRKSRCVSVCHTAHTAETI